MFAFVTLLCGSSFYYMALAHVALVDLPVVSVVKVVESASWWQGVEKKKSGRKSLAVLTN